MEPKARSQPSLSADSSLDSLADEVVARVTHAVNQSSEDLAQGQIVTVTARWILVLAGLVLALWDPDPLGQLRIQLLVLILLSVGNFYLHAQLLTRRPVPAWVVYAATCADFTVVTALVISQGGFGSDLYIFYFPAILAFSVAFQTRMTCRFAGAAVLLYALTGLGSPTVTSEDAQVLLTRLIMLVAVAVCGNLYWRIERDRRWATVTQQESVLRRIGERERPAPAANG